MEPLLQSICEDVLRQYEAVIPAPRTLSRVTGGFSGALVVRVKAGPQTWCLRRWPPDTLPHPRVVELHRWLHTLHQQGIPVPVPIECDVGETLALVEGHRWQLERWLPGRADFLPHRDTVRLKAILRALARLHVTSSAYRSSAAGEEWFSCRRGPSPSVEFRLNLLQQTTPERLRPLEARLGSSDPLVRSARKALSLIEVAAPRAMARLASVREVSVPLFPCLRDVWHDHILLMGDEVTGIIDPAATRTESVATDLSRLIGSLVGNDPRLWRIALDAYSEVRPLSEAEERLIPALDLSGVVLSAMTWVDRIATGSLEQDAERVRKRLETFIERLQNPSGGPSVDGR